MTSALDACDQCRGIPPEHWQLGINRLDPFVKHLSDQYSDCRRHCLGRRAFEALQTNVRFQARLRHRAEVEVASIDNRHESWAGLRGRNAAFVSLEEGDRG